jgi:DNA-directed RNA polymerase specialized sigma24 family protein
MREELYKQIRDHAFNLAHFMTKNYHDAEDIAQIVSLKYLLNEKDVHNPFAWSKTVTKHEVYSRNKEGQKSAQLQQKDQLENYEDNLTEFMDDMERSEKEVRPVEAKELLSRDDFRIFKH